MAQARASYATLLVVQVASALVAAVAPGRSPGPPSCRALRGTSSHRRERRSV